MKPIDRRIDRLQRAIQAKQRGHKPRATMRRELTKLVAVKLTDEIRNPPLPLEEPRHA